MEKKTVTVEVGRRALGICRNKMAELLKNGEIHAIKSGRRWIIPIWAIDKFLEGKNP